jgi:peptide/nickel transport system permease protein
MIMPSITLGAPVAALITRMTRAGMIDVLSEDYILNALSKGIPRRTVITKYALKNVLIPIVTVVGIQIGVFLGGAIVTEQIFNLPGIGRMIVQSISRRDFPLVQSSLLVISALFVFINLLVDIIYTLIDPRLNMAGFKIGKRIRKEGRLREK